MTMGIRNGIAALALALGASMAATDSSNGADVNDIASRFPRGAGLFLRAPGAVHIAAALDFYRQRAADIADDPGIAWLASFKEKTGLDPGDPVELKKTGIDIAKPLAAARYDNPEGASYLAMVPVAAGRRLPFAFIKLMKKARGWDGLDLIPTVSRHGHHRVFQMKDNIFFTANRGHMIISSREELLKSALDLSDGKKDAPSMYDDGPYLEITNRTETGDAIVLFFGRGLPWKGPAKKTDDDAPSDGTGIVRASGLALKTAGRQFFARFVASLNPTSEETAPLLAALMPDPAARFIGGSGPSFFLHLSMDLDVIGGGADGDGGPSPYPRIQKTLNMFNENLHLDFSQDLLPLAGKAVSFITEKNSGNQEFILTISKKSGADVGGLKRELFRKVRKKNDDTENARTAGGIDVLKAKKERGDTFYAVNERGLFIGSSRPLIEKELASPGVSMERLRPSASFPGKTFLAAGLDARKESVIKTMVQLALLQSDRRLFHLVENSGMITATGSLDGNNVIIDITAEPAENDEKQTQESK